MIEVKDKAETEISKAPKREWTFEYELHCPLINLLGGCPQCKPVGENHYLYGHEVFSTSELAEQFALEKFIPSWERSFASARFIQTVEL